MSRIVTFYSYKGGVGRTFALANIAVLLAKRGKKVLLMDWDLEAPGLHRYFEAFRSRKSRGNRGLIHLLGEAAGNPDAKWREFVEDIRIDPATRLYLLPSGDNAHDYIDRVRAFSWTNFFEHQEGGSILEQWRTEWKENFDFVLIDSRTGITDAGGVCTILLPDILVLAFAANNQSFEGGIQVAHNIQKSRKALNVPRAQAAILPLLGRFDGRDEIDDASAWLDRLADGLKPFYDDWLPKRLSIRRMLELTKIPYISKFSFGEPLAVLSHGVSDPELPGFFLENLTRLLASDFIEASDILSPEAPSDEEQLVKIFEKALAEKTENLGITHPDTLSAMNNLASALSDLGVFSRAYEIQVKAHEIRSRIYGPEHPETLNSMSNLATILVGLGRLQEAAALEQEILAIYRRLFEADHPGMRLHMQNLANILLRLGSHEEASSLTNRLREMRQNDDRRERAANKLRDAVASNAYHILFEPRFNLQTGEIIAAQVRIRWFDRELERMTDEQVMELAASFRLTIPIDHILLAAGIDQLERLNERGDQEIIVAINLSFRGHPLDAPFAEYISSRILVSGIPSNRLEIGVTESLLTSGNDEIFIALIDLKRNGFRLCINNFGTGYSSLKHLTGHQVDAIKIDSSFVRKIATSRESSNVVKTMISLGRSLDIGIIADGIEDRNQLNILRDSLCEEGQGPFLGSLLEATSFLQKVVNGRSKL